MSGSSYERLSIQSGLSKLPADISCRKNYIEKNNEMDKFEYSVNLFILVPY